MCKYCLTEEDRIKVHSKEQDKGNANTERTCFFCHFGKKKKKTECEVLSMTVVKRTFHTNSHFAKITYLI